MCRAPAAFCKNKQAVHCSVGKLFPSDSDVIIQTNKLPVHQRFDDGNWAGAQPLDIAFLICTLFIKIEAVKLIQLMVKATKCITVTGTFLGEVFGI